MLRKVVWREKVFLPQASLLPLILLFAAAFLSFRNTIDVSDSIHGVTKLLKDVLIVLVVCDQIKEKREMHRIVFAMACGAILVTCDAGWQLLTNRDFIRGNQLQQAIGLIRPTASFPNPNVMGVYLTAITPLLVCVALFAFEKVSVLLVVAGFMGALGVVLTISRGAGLGLAAGILFAALIRRNRIIPILVLSGLLLLPVAVPGKIKKWARSVNYNPLVMLLNSDRISIQRNTINMIAHHPVTGVGINTFVRNYPKYKLASAEAYCPTPEAIYAHNIYLQMAAETGLFGLGVFLYLLFTVFAALRLFWRSANDRFLVSMAAGLAGSMIAFMINGLTETSLYYSRVAMIFWYIIGVSLALCYRLGERNG